MGKVIYMLVEVVILQEAEVCPEDLHLKHIILSSVKKILNCESFMLISREMGNLVISSCFIYI